MKSFDLHSFILNRTTCTINNLPSIKNISFYSPYKFVLNNRYDFLNIEKGIILSLNQYKTRFYLNL